MKRRISAVVPARSLEERGSKALKTTLNECSSSTESELLPSDTEAALLYVRGLFPAGLGPPIVLQHQLYGLLKDKTSVDREIISLKDNRKLRIIKLETSSEDYGLVSHEDYVSTITSSLGGGRKGEQLVGKIMGLLTECVDVTVTKEKLTSDYKLTDEDMSLLITGGVLVLKEINKGNKVWWFSLPGISSFKKDLIKGRSSVLQIMKRLKYKEILQSDLEKKKLSGTRLPMEYFTLDIIGSETVESIETSSGPLLRLLEQ